MPRLRIPALRTIRAFESVRHLEGKAMGDVVNLKRFRKRSAREQAAKDAEANRARFGRGKSERDADATRRKRASELLDQHRIDGEDAS
jgi:hypothetical protein